MPNSLTLTLTPPVKHEGGTVDTLTLREPTAAEAEAAEAARVKQTDMLMGWRRREMSLLQACSGGVTEEAFNEFPISVYQRAADFLVGLLTNSPDIDPGNPGEACSLPLDPPLKGPNGATYTQLSLCEPSLAQVARAEASMNGRSDDAAVRRFQISLVHQVAEVPYPVGQMLPITVLNQAAAYLAGFTSGGREAGAS